MNQEIKYSDAPTDIEESLNRVKIIPNFEISQEQLLTFVSKKIKKPIGKILKKPPK